VCRMVDYQELVKAAFEVGKEAGMRNEFGGESSDLVKVVAALWNRDKQELKAMAYTEAKKYIRRKVKF